MLFDLTGKTAIVTGATGGIGNAIVDQLHQQGAMIGITGSKTEKIAKLASQYSERVIALPACNLLDTNSIKELVEVAYDKMQKIDILVNNAGLTKDSLLLRMSEEQWDEVLNVNLKASFLLSKYVINGMIKQRYGRIVNISSVVGAKGNIGQANYVASKAGLIGLTKATALEYAPRNITVNAVAPGFITTLMTNDLDQRIKDELLSYIPQKKFGDINDVASAVVYLVSNEAKYITGQTLHINGGMYM